MHRCLSLLPLLLAACSEDATPIPGPSEGQALFQQHCADCHGSTGRGDGPAGASLTPPPADLSRIAARRGGVWPVLEVMSIVDGYTRATVPRPGMPVIEALTQGEQVAFDTGNGQVSRVPANLLAVARYLETLQNPPPERYVP